MEDLNLSPEELDLLMSLGYAPEELGDLGKKEELYNALRYGEGPQGRQAGRVFVAANPLEAIGDMVGKYKAGKKLESVEGSRKEVYDRLRRGRSLYGNLGMGYGGGLGPVGNTGGSVPPIQAGPLNLPPPATLSGGGGSGPVGPVGPPPMGGPMNRGGIRRPTNPMGPNTPEQRFQNGIQPPSAPPAPSAPMPQTSVRGAVAPVQGGGKEGALQRLLQMAALLRGGPN